ncbi:MAG: amidase, partial [Chloroflexi bacterium]|nr:amidase [Chloroflexota bacterium]
MAQSSEYVSAFAPAHVLLDALRSRRVSAVELLGMYRERIAKYNPVLNALVIPNDQEADSQARAADAALALGAPMGALTGLPMTIKDCIETRGLPTTAGVPERFGTIAAHDAPIAGSVRAAGAVIMAKTNTSTDCGDWQADNALFGRTNNPWDLTRTPGGSTGGGAAALAAGLTALELGSDIGGSIRVPSAFCGLYGHRPSDSILPRYGFVPGWPAHNPGMMLQALGPLARSPIDLELAMDVMVGPVAGEDVAWRLQLAPARRASLREYRVALLPWQEWLPVDREIVTAFEDCADRLRKHGVHVETASPEGFDLQAQEELYISLLAVMEGRILTAKKRASLSAAARRTGSSIGA